MNKYVHSRKGVEREDKVLEKEPLGPAGGIVVEFACSASVAPGLWVQVLGVDLALLIKPHCGGSPHKIAKRRRLATDVSSGPIFLTHKKKEKRKNMHLKHVYHLLTSFSAGPILY